MSGPPAQGNPVAHRWRGLLGTGACVGVCVCSSADGMADGGVGLARACMRHARAHMRHARIYADVYADVCNDQKNRTGQVTRRADHAEWLVSSRQGECPRCCCARVRGLRARDLRAVHAPELEMASCDSRRYVLNNVLLHFNLQTTVATARVGPDAPGPDPRSAPMTRVVHEIAGRYAAWLCRAPRVNHDELFDTCLLAIDLEDNGDAALGVDLVHASRTELPVGVAALLRRAFRSGAYLDRTSSHAFVLSVCIANALGVRIDDVNGDLHLDSDSEDDKEPCSRLGQPRRHVVSD
jgi:hypothetical protein